MKRAARFLFTLLALSAAACSAQSEPEESAPESNPVDRRVEPVRQRAAEADRLMRAREAEVAELAADSVP